MVGQEKFFWHHPFKMVFKDLMSCLLKFSFILFSLSFWFICLI